MSITEENYCFLFYFTLSKERELEKLREYFGCWDNYCNQIRKYLFKRRRGNKF
jgi:hypothetical protein